MWTDPQCLPPVAYCHICGGEIYGLSGCARCRRRAVIPDRKERCRGA